MIKSIQNLRNKNKDKQSQSQQTIQQQDTTIQQIFKENFQQLKSQNKENNQIQDQKFQKNLVHQIDNSSSNNNTNNSLIKRNKELEEMYSQGSSIQIINKKRKGKNLAEFDKNIPKNKKVQLQKPKFIHLIEDDYEQQEDKDKNGEKNQKKTKKKVKEQEPKIMKQAINKQNSVIICSRADKHTGELIVEIESKIVNLRNEVNIICKEYKASQIRKYNGGKDILIDFLLKHLKWKYESESEGENEKIQNNQKNQENDNKNKTYEPEQIVQHFKNQKQSKKMQIQIQTQQEKTISCTVSSSKSTERNVFFDFKDEPVYRHKLTQETYFTEEALYQQKKKQLKNNIIDGSNSSSVIFENQIQKKDQIAIISINDDQEQKQQQQEDEEEDLEDSFSCFSVDSQILQKRRKLIGFQYKKQVKTALDILRLNQQKQDIKTKTLNQLLKNIK